jgi:hypothetical protein
MVFQYSAVASEGRVPLSPMFIFGAPPKARIDALHAEIGAADQGRGSQLSAAKPSRARVDYKRWRFCLTAVEFDHVSYR